MNDFTISIPTSKRDIKLKEWQEFQSILEKNKDDKGSGDFLNLKMLQIFCGVDLDMIKNIPMNQFNGILSHLDEVFSDKSNRINTFKLRGTDGVEVEFGLIPNLNDMSYGEYIDLEKYIYDYKTAHRAMAVLYRPVQYKKGETYHIQRYKGSDHLADVMKDAPLDVFLGVQVFFYNLAKKLGLYTMDYTLQSFLTKEDSSLENPSERSGENTNQYIHLQREMLQDLIRSQE